VGDRVIHLLRAAFVHERPLVGLFSKRDRALRGGAAGSGVHSTVEPAVCEGLASAATALRI
jgi:hypothetical protein